MCNASTSIPQAVCLYLGLISSLHSPSASLNHNGTALCHIQLLLPFTKKKASIFPAGRVSAVFHGIAEVVCGKWDAVALMAPSAFIAASHCELLFLLLQMCFLFG